MIIFWSVIFVLTLYAVIAVAGSWILQFLVVVGVVVSTPIREVIRLYKSNQKKKANALLASFSFAIAMLLLLAGLLIAMP